MATEIGPSTFGKGNNLGVECGHWQRDFPIDLQTLKSNLGLMDNSAFIVALCRPTTNFTSLIGFVMASINY